ncbi:aldehyde dehydrogenase family protein [Micromonospora sp. NPDC048830]|uniref:aldehyde dehydrogenase family protein n=1 Tax=Micromonospora sp. NPDC048830 TaxID=3364257 RepID=UPI003720251C
MKIGMPWEDVRRNVSGHPWRLLVGGELIPAEGNRRYAVTSPAAGSAVCAVPDASEADVARAVAAAVSAAGSWRETPIRERARRVRALASIARAHAEELALLDAVDVGNTVTWMMRDVEAGADGLELMADLALGLAGETIPGPANLLHLTEREPVGVVARIVAFNHPAMFALQKIAAPLVAGNPVILKPSNQSPLSALRVGELFGEELPPGVLSVLSAEGLAAPRALVRHPDVRRIGFIGSEQAGRSIQREAAEAGVKDVTLELGGKNAIVVFPDVDVTAAAAAVVKGMNFQGWQSQSCSSTSRVFVHEDVADAVVEMVAELVGQIVVGDPLDPRSEMGPMASVDQFEKVSTYLRDALDAGCRLVVGGTGSSAGQPLDGLYLRPTVIDGVRPDMRVAREEVFGPLLSVLRWRDTRTMLDQVNSVRHGLTAAVICRDIATAHLVARRIEAGYVWINDSASHYPGVPFGGYKASGLGREESIEELISYTQLKAVTVRLDRFDEPVWRPGTSGPTAFGIHPVTHGSVASKGEKP